MAKVDETSPVVRGDRCWLWTGAVDPKGYGQFKLRGKARWAHRVSYELSHSRLRPGLDINHICFNRSCVNPRHLRATSRQANSSRQPSRAQVAALAEEAPF
jgi:hypothetical protein